MRRDQYLELCKQYSLVPKGIGKQPTEKHPELIVKYYGNEYYPLNYTLGYEDGKIRHWAILRELNSNTILEVPLAKVEAI